MNNNPTTKIWGERIVIGGLPRSGSTLFRLMLDSSDSIICPPETGFFIKPFSYRKKRITQSAKRLNRALQISEDVITKIIKNSSTSIDAFDLMMDAFKQKTGYSQKQVWAEKSPRNCLVYHLLNKQSENIKFISVVRDGRAVVTSRMGTSMEYHCSIERYISTMEAVLGFESHNHRIIKYEDLVTNPTKTLSGIFEWVHLPFSEDCVVEYSKPGATRNIESHQQRLLGESVQKTQIDRWKLPEYQNRIADFISNQRAMSLLRRSGYR